MIDQRYTFQSRLAQKFLTECRKIAGQKDALILMQQVIKVLGNVLEADLCFLASLSKSKKRGEPVYIIQPLGSLSFRRTGKNYRLLRGKMLEEFVLTELKHYEKRSVKMPPPLTGKKMIRYIVSEDLKLFYGQKQVMVPGEKSRDYCLIFAWNESFSGPPEAEGQLYTTELFSLISELAAYVINNILLELRYKELSAIFQATGSLQAFLTVQKESEPVIGPETRQERSNFASNWAVMDVLNQRSDSIEALKSFINMNFEYEDLITKSSILRVWEWLKWLVENEGSPDDQKKIEDLKTKFLEQDGPEKQTLETRLRETVMNGYTAVMKITHGNR